MRLIDETGSVQEAARKFGLSQPYVSQIKTRARNMGGRTARKIEAIAGYPPGYMDLPPEQSELLKSAIESLSEDELVSVLESRIPDLSPEGAQKLALALLSRNAQ